VRVRARVCVFCEIMNGGKDELGVSLEVGAGLGGDMLGVVEDRPTDELSPTAPLEQAQPSSVSLPGVTEAAASPSGAAEAQGTAADQSHQKSEPRASTSTSAATKKMDKVRKLCDEADREWRKNIKRKICDASVVTEQIAEYALKLLREHRLKAASKKDTMQLNLVNKSEYEKLASDQSIGAIADHRLANLANKSTLLILERLMSHKWAWLFNEPVNAEELNLKDYHTIVKKPMALSTVKNRAQMGLYKTASEAASDIRLVFKNAQLYNKPGTDVNIMASAMLEKFEELWQSKVIQKFSEDENLAKQEESVARKKRIDAVRAQQNGEFRQKCQSYERLLCDVENFLVDAQQQILVSCKPLAKEKREKAQSLIENTAFEKMKPALAVILQRYPEMLNTSTQEIEVDLSKVDPLTLRQVLMLLEKADGNGDSGASNKKSSSVEREFDSWINAMSFLVKLKQKKQKREKKTAPPAKECLPPVGDKAREYVDLNS